MNIIFLLQYNPPVSAAEYVHRVGRTARIGAQGSSLLFLTPSETAFVDVLANHNIRCADWHLIKIRFTDHFDELRHSSRGLWGRSCLMCG